jgi:hypothetical protein
MNPTSTTIDFSGKVAIVTGGSSMNARTRLSNGQSIPCAA